MVLVSLLSMKRGWARTMKAPPVLMPRWRCQSYAHIILLLNIYAVVIGDQMAASDLS